MRILSLVAIFVFLLTNALPCYAAEADTDFGENQSSICSRFLREARVYRSKNRYELARQSFTQALSICQDYKSVETAKEGLNSIELLLRTMR